MRFVTELPPLRISFVVALFLIAAGHVHAEPFLQPLAIGPANAASAQHDRNGMAPHGVACELTASPSRGGVPPQRVVDVGRPEAVATWRAVVVGVDRDRSRRHTSPDPQPFGPPLFLRHASLLI